MSKIFELVPFSEERSKEFFLLTDRNRKYLRKWLPWLDGTRDESDSLNFLRSSIDTDEKQKSLNFFIIVDTKIVGTIGLREVTDETALVGYWIDEEHQAKGIVTGALVELINFSKKNKVTKNIILRCSPSNIASARIAEKCGFTFVETLKEAENLYGKKNDLDVYNLEL